MDVVQGSTKLKQTLMQIEHRGHYCQVSVFNRILRIGTEGEPGM